jgi:hypothetical protein
LRRTGQYSQEKPPASITLKMLALFALTGVIIRGPPTRPCSGKPVSATTFDPKDGRVSKVDYFNGPGASANCGLKKVSAERSITFLLDYVPQMPLQQKREVRQRGSCLRPSPTPAQSSPL